ncbi:hypothetical protein [Roseibium alexandrii]|uniref:hypothetical protein n=1 Tax=Roseibium alexandrii TaxID=388408 RepID=UPI001F1B4DBC|nr:hypothetical protein [Roseibium alexandrii]
MNRSYQKLGELYLSELGLAARIKSEGVYPPNDRLHRQFRAFGEDGTLLTRIDALPALSIERVRQVLLDEWSPWERAEKLLLDTYNIISIWYQNLGWLKAPFWPFLGWLLAICAATTTWILAPHRLANWAMPKVGSPKIPTWKWLAGVLTLFGYLGTTRRPLKAWIRKNRGQLEDQCFLEREPVKERDRYCELGHQPDIDDFHTALSSRTDGLRWIQGVGGTGKSALAYRMLKTAIVPGWIKNPPLPILIDEDWGNSLPAHISRLMRLNDRRPTEQMIEVFAASGFICPIIDALSERGMSDAVDQIEIAVGDKGLSNIIVTSRSSLPSGQIWERFGEIKARKLTPEFVPDFIRTYAPADRVEEVSQKVDPLLSNGGDISPLFLRFAIEQALIGDISATTAHQLVLNYVEALRAGKLDLNSVDMRRAAEITAIEAIRNSDTLTPQELEDAYLRGVLVREADKMPFMDAKREKKVDPLKVIDMLIFSGLLNRNAENMKLQFAYDPVAEYLAATWIAEAKDSDSASSIKQAVMNKPEAAVTQMLSEINFWASNAAVSFSPAPSSEPAPVE